MSKSATSASKIVADVVSKTPAAPASRRLRLTKFSELSIDDPFFDSLKKGYSGFPGWFKSKADAGEELYVVDDVEKLSGMIYLKAEDGEVVDVDPPLPAQKWLKVGTLKIEGRGTRLGERVLKKILDTAIADGRDGIYVTVFELHEDLIQLFERYGFQRRSTKTTDDGIELVLARDLRDLSGDIIHDYPFVHSKGRKSWLLAIYPEYHSRLLPDSILNNEPREIVKDVSHTNTIHKMYIGRVPLTRMSPGDIVVFYRTTDHQAPARFRSVATSICVVEGILSKKDFASAESFIEYAKPHSVFTEEELRSEFEDHDRLYVARMTYNAAFGKRLTRGTLLDEVGVTEQPRWDLRELTSEQLAKIVELGNVDARIVVD